LLSGSGAGSSVRQKTAHFLREKKMPDISLLFLLSPSQAALMPRIAAAGHACHVVTDPALPVPVSANTLTVLCGGIMPPLEHPDYAHAGIGPLEQFIRELLNAHTGTPQDRAALCRQNADRKD
jgi:hypothetical protein